MDQLKQFSQAVLNGVGQANPGSYIPEVANFFSGKFNLGGVERAGKAMGTAAAQIADDEEKRRRAAQEAEAQRLQDLIDPSKYQKLRKDDGGFAFYDPTGKEIDIDTFAKRTGQRRVDVLKDSENPVDLQYIDDYQMMNQVNQAVWNNDTAALEELKLLGLDTNSTPEELNKKMLEKYPHIYGMGNYQKSYSNLGSPLFRQSMGGSTGGSGNRRSSLSL